MSGGGPGLPRVRKREGLITFILALLLQPPGFFYVERVVDGDTIVVRDVGVVRLLGVDTPETVDPRRPMGPCGRAASSFTKGMLTHKYIALEIDQRNGRDRYGRLLAYVWYQGLFNERLVRMGYARVTTRWPFDRKGQLLTAQRLAQREGLRIWARCPCCFLQ